MAKGDVLVRMKADVSNYDANIAKARKTLDGFKQDNLTLGGIMNQSTKSIVAAAAQYASFAAVLGTVASGFAEAASKGMEMSKEAEGVKAAFDRLNQPGLLDNLREATHGTVNDLELMKQAVKFDNFNLSLEQMGTFLAFAQQQAKDTGQDVNFLVDSIVTGLGRKSLPILDNLGLSAEEIKNRMKETGDMTTAVAKIIQERMEAAGGYVETAADRAAQGQARLDNAMKKLGDTMNALTVDGASLWTELEVGAINLANNAIKPLILRFKLLGYMFKSLTSFFNGPSKEDIVTRGMTDVTDTVDDNGRLIRKNAIPSIPEITVSGTAPKTTRRSGRSKSKGFDISSIAFDNNKALLSAVKGTDEGPSEIWKAITQGAKESTNAVDQLTDAFEALNKAKGDANTGEIAKDGKVVKGSFNDAAGAVGSLGSALAGLDDPAAKIAGVIAQSIANVALAFSSAQLKDAETGNVWYWIAAVASGAAAMVSTIATIHSATGYARGGVIKAANGAAIPGTFTVPGTTYSNDQIPAMLNAGETVLTRAQAGNIASQLQGAGGSINLNGVLTGENIFLSADRYARRSGRGELVTFHR